VLPVDLQTQTLVFGGQERVLLNESHLPPHNHLIRSATATLADALSLNLIPGPSTLLSSEDMAYSCLHLFCHNLIESDTLSSVLPLLGTLFGLASSPLQSLRPESIGTTGSGASHENMQPFAVVQMIIATNYSDTFPTNTILAYGGKIPPANWSLCDGTSGTLDLRGRVMIHRGTGVGLATRVYGTFGGAVNVSLSLSELSTHSHTMRGSSASGTSTTPNGNIVCGSLLGTDAPNTNLHTSSVSSVGSGDAHNNMAPSMSLSYIVSTATSIPPVGALAHLVNHLQSADPAGGEMVSIGQPINPTLRGDLGSAFAGTSFATTFQVPDVSGRFLIGTDVTTSVGALSGTIEETLLIK
jgi:microcystin-dependent protein